MSRSGDKRNPARSLRAQFDDEFGATSQGGAVLVEQVMRRLGVRRLLQQSLPARSETSEYSSAEIGYAVLAGLLCGGEGFRCAEKLREDTLFARVFGLEERVGEEATVWRAMCEMAGLDKRKFRDTYEPAGPALTRLDMFGRTKLPARHRRVVCSQPEAMRDANREQFAGALACLAVKCAKVVGASVLRVGPFIVVHGDGTDLEVRGRCFDAARVNHEGNCSLRQLLVRCGPIHCAQDILPGASDEGLNIPRLLSQAADTVIDKVKGSRRVLALLDAAYCEKAVVDELNRLNWLYVICANQNRLALEQQATQLASWEWKSQGPDVGRGWSESQVSTFRYMPEGWTQPQTVIVRRWREVDDLPGHWHYAFLYTNLAKEDLEGDKVRQYGYAAYLWMLYSTKQGHENHFKPLLSDLGGHHPPSGRLGATQAFAFFTAMAANIHAVLAYKVVDHTERGIRPWRTRRDYFSIAGRVVMQAGRVLMVTLAGANLSDMRKRLWQSAFATAGRL